MSFVNIPKGNNHGTSDFRVGTTPGVQSIDNFSSARRVNQTIGWSTNARIVKEFEIFRYVDKLDDTIGKGQFAFVYNNQEHSFNSIKNFKVNMCNLPLMNWVLAKKSTSETKLCDVVDSWKPVGLVTTDFEDSTRNTDKRSKVLNCAVCGHERGFNVWGTDVRDYTKLFFIIKKVKTDNRNMYFNLSLEGASIKNVHTDSDMVFQVIPYAHHMHDFPPNEELEWTEEDGSKHYGTYWYVGRCHRAANIIHSNFSEHYKRVVHKDIAKMCSKTKLIDIFIDN